MKRETKHEKYKRWYEKGFWWVDKKECAVCGSEFYTLFNDQRICDQKTCKKRWDALEQEAGQKDDG